jgi:FdhD protein
MGRGLTKKLLSNRFDGQRATRGPDEVIVEAPMEIRLDEHLVATTMRTPGHDFELAVGFCHADGLIDGIVVQRVRYCGAPPPGDDTLGERPKASDSDYNVVTVDTAGVAPEPAPRLGVVSSSCGLCGAPSIADLRERLGPVIARPIELSVMASMPDRVRDSQKLFAATGAVHAAAAFTAEGEPVVVREDIGRHNAVDKVVGALLLERRLPATDLGLFVSGRASFEMVQKAWAAGFPAVVAVSGPSSMAVEAARAAGIALAGFTRDGTLNLYAPETI